MIAEVSRSPGVRASVATIAHQNPTTSSSPPTAPPPAPRSPPATPAAGRSRSASATSSRTSAPRTRRPGNAKAPNAPPACPCGCTPSPGAGTSTPTPPAAPGSPAPGTPTRARPASSMPSPRCAACSGPNELQRCQPPQPTTPKSPTCCWTRSPTRHEQTPDCESPLTSTELNSKSAVVVGWARWCAQHHPGQELGQHLVDQPQRHRRIMPGCRWWCRGRSAGVSRVSGTYRPPRSPSPSSRTWRCPARRSPRR